MIDPLLKITNLNISFNTLNGSFHAVKDANLTIYPGQTISIVGQSGSGKSTLASAIIKLLSPNAQITSGQIIFDGDDITLFDDKEMQNNIRGKKIGLVPQDPMTNLNPVLTIGFQVRESLQVNKNLKGKNINDEIISILEKSGIDKIKINQYPHELSGGLKQRTLIAIAMSCKPKLLIADEPTSALDVTVQKNIMDFISEITKSLNTSMLFITHDLCLAAQRSDHVIVMYKGSIVESGPPLVILKNPQHPYTKKLINAIPSISGSSSFYRKAISENTIIKVENLTKEFFIKDKGRKKKFLAVDNINFSVKEGITLAIVGESGSGKSTLANIILNLIYPTLGKIYYKGKDLSLFNYKQLFDLRKKMQVVFQNPYGSLDPMYTIYKCIEEPLLIHKMGNKQQRFEKISKLLELVKLPQEILNRFPNELSGGQRQRVAIARALSLDPEVLILDEAVSALDVLIQDQILKLLHEIQSQFNLTYIFITHDLAVVRKIADEVMVIRNGKIVEMDLTDKIFTNPSDEYTKNLINSVPIL